MRPAAGATESWTENPSLRRSLFMPILLFVAVVWTVALVVFSLDEGLLAWDLRFAYVPAAEEVLDGRSPYPGLDDPILEDQKGYVYPPQLVLLLLPFTAVPIDVLAVGATIVLLLLLGLTLRVLGVRDVRCYAAAVLWMPVASGLVLANVSIPLTLAVALAWVYRDRVWPPAVALGLAISAKLVLWPLLVWTLFTRRLGVTVWAVVVGAVATFGAWAAIGFDGLTGYPDLLRRLSEIQSENSYSFVGMASTLGLGEGVGRALALVIGGGLLVACAVLARRGDDFRAFTCAVAATLALSPIVWLHYLVVLVVPLAIARPRFSLLWLLPILLWGSPRPGYAEGVQTLFPFVATVVLVAILLARPGAARTSGPAAPEPA